MADPINMFHPGTGGTAIAERQTYRDVWYVKGWRSNDDPTFVPSLTLDSSRYLHVPDNWGNHWFEARKDASTRVVKVHTWGDSITVGDDGGDGTGVAGFRDFGYFGRVGTAIQAKYGNAGSGLFPIGLATKTGTWTDTLGYGGSASTATAAASIEWSGVAGTTILIYHKNSSITGTLRYQIDGGSFTNVTPPTGFGLEPGSVTVTGLSDTTHTVRVEWVSGTVTVHGVEGRRGTTGVRPGRFAMHGVAASQYSSYPINQQAIPVTTTNGSATITCASPGSFDASFIGRRLSGTNVPLGASITAVASATSATMSGNASGTGTVTASFTQPLYTGTSGLGSGTLTPFLAEGQGQADLVIMALGVNDPSGIPHSQETLCDGLSRLIRPYLSFTGGSDPHYTPDFVFVINHIGNWFDTEIKYPQFVAAQRYMADSVGAAVLDMWELGQRSWLYMKDIQYWAGVAHDNSVHPGGTGHQLIADALVRLIV